MFLKRNKPTYFRVVYFVETETESYSVIRGISLNRKRDEF